MYALDPLMVVSALWPSGTYTLVQPSSGCPTGWYSGYLRHDTENSNNDNDARRGMMNYLKIPWDNNFITVHYCTKTSVGTSAFSWPPGKYCIGRYGGSCPSGFYDGSLKWDDEDSSNKNLYQNPILDKTEGNANPRLHYCCRSDGSAADSIFLPPHQPFAMYRYGGTCQKVYGMIEQEWWVIFDTENYRDDSDCQGNHPDQDNCGGNIHLWYCSYTPIVGLKPWPYGQYSLIQGTGYTPGVCANGLSSGYLRHDTENTNNQNDVPKSVYEYLWIPTSSDYSSTWYCTKTEDGNATTDGHFPPGRYCIAKRGSSCPEGFSGGSILWDDEDTDNRNRKYEYYPTTSEDLHNIRVYYCCRRDGNANTPIDLPYDAPFGLYRYGGHCQQVNKMTVTQLKIHLDDENYSNDDECVGKHPDDDSCNNDHELWVCAYRPSGI